MKNYNTRSKYYNRRVAQFLTFDDLLAVIMLVPSVYCVWGMLA